MPQKLIRSYFNTDICSYEHEGKEGVRSMYRTTIGSNFNLGIKLNPSMCCSIKHKELLSHPQTKWIKDNFASRFHSCPAPSASLSVPSINCEAAHLRWSRWNVKQESHMSQRTLQVWPAWNKNLRPGQYSNRSEWVIKHLAFTFYLKHHGGEIDEMSVVIIE